MSGILLLLAVLPNAMAVTWPADTDWEPIQLNGADIEDVCGDVSGSSWWDIVGDETAPAAYWTFDGTNLWFRLRVGDEPFKSSGGGKVTAWAEFGWGVMMETDWELSKYDYILYVDGKGEEVSLGENTTGTTDFTTDSPEVTLATYGAAVAASGDSTADHAGYVLADSDLCGGGTSKVDYFVDWYVPWADVAAATGASDPSEFGFALGTSASTKRFSKDIAGCDASTTTCTSWADLFSDADGDTDGDGLSNNDEVDLGTDPLVEDTDADGLSDGEEVNTTTTDPLDTDSDDDGLTDGQEVLTYSTDPNDSDTDGDGLLDGAEVGTH